MKLYRVKYLIFVIFLIVGSVFALVIPSFETKKEARCTLETEAVVADIAEHYSENQDGGGSTTYAPVYSFTIDGTAEEITPSVYTGTRPVIGDSVTIFVNPDNHSEIFDPARDGEFVKIFRIVGIVFIVIAFISLFAIRKPRLF